MTINLIECTIYEPWYEDIVSLGIIAQVSVISITVGVLTRLA